MQSISFITCYITLLRYSIIDLNQCHTAIEAIGVSLIGTNRSICALDSLIWLYCSTYSTVWSDFSSHKELCEHKMRMKEYIVTARTGSPDHKSPLTPAYAIYNHKLPSYGQKFHIIHNQTFIPVQAGEY